jgi:hypothetical protein
MATFQLQKAAADAATARANAVKATNEAFPDAETQALLREEQQAKVKNTRAEARYKEAQTNELNMKTAGTLPLSAVDAAAVAKTQQEAENLRLDVEAKKKALAGEPPPVTQDQILDRRKKEAEIAVMEADQRKKQADADAAIASQYELSGPAATLYYNALQAKSNTRQTLNEVTDLL